MQTGKKKKGVKVGGPARKYVTEYAIGYMNSYSSVITAYQLSKGGEMTAADKSETAKCHIYIIAARPLPYFNKDALKHDGKSLSGSICYKIDGCEHSIEFADYPFELLDGATSIDCKYPHREITTVDSEGREVRYLPASHLSFLHSMHINRERSDLNSYEVLYVGQALGDDGSRSSIDRLKSHSTLQKILGMTTHDYPDKEIVIFMYQFNNDQVLASMDGRAKDANDSEENEDRLVSTIHNPPQKKQKIGMIEAGLIRYFQPHYNEVFKVKFPSTKHKVLESCRNLDITGLAVEIDCSDLSYYLYSRKVDASNHHLAQFDLVASNNRMSFFSATGFANNPSVIA